MAKAAKAPWMKWYPADWRQEPTLRLCSRAARCLWVDMLCLMHEGEPYGHLTVNNKPLSAKQLAAVLGDAEKDVAGWLAELDENAVLSRTDEGVIFSRRMVKDKAREERNRANGEISGGNPNLLRGTVPKEKRVRPFKRSDSPNKTQRIFDRSGGKCHWCGVVLSWEDEYPAGVPPNIFHVDHLVAVRDGGTNDESNLVASCAACNHKRARKDSVGQFSDLNVGKPSDTKAQKLEARSQKLDSFSEERASKSVKTEEGLDLPPFLRADLRPRFDTVKGGAKRFAGLGERPFKPKNPVNADQDLLRHLTTQEGMDAFLAQALIVAARDPENPDHTDAARQCEKISRKHKLGWFHLEAAE